MPHNELRRNDNNIRPGLQMLIFVVIFIGVLLVGSAVGAGIDAALYGSKIVMDIASLNLSTPHIVPALWIIQLTGTTLPIFIAPVIFSYMVVRYPGDYLKPSWNFSWMLLVLVFAIMMLSNPMIEFLSDINEKMVLPQWLKWMRDSEDNAEKMMEVMLQMKSFTGLVFDVLAVGLLTAIAEEFMFRGVIQTILMRWTKNTHVAIWFTAILFSAFHMEFFGFLPRLALGLFFGYFVVWSGSIWPAVWAHFLNNASAVVLTYLFQHKQLNFDPNNQHIYGYFIYAFSTVIVGVLLFIYRALAAGRRLGTVYTDGK